MVRIQLARITRSRKGDPIRAERTIEAEAPAVGRGAHCAIHLTDPRVALEHAQIFTAEGARRIAGVGGAVLVVEGRLTGELALAPGSRFEIGPYLFNVESPPAGCDLALTYELTRPLPDTLAEIVANSRFTLAAEGVSKRAIAWGGFAVIVVLFLLVPIVNAVTPVLRALTAQLKLTPDVAWNPGKLASGHASLSYDCGKCHMTLFLRVRDKACLACHQDMPGHAHNRDVQARLFGHTRCAECHADHRGADVPVRSDAGLCLPCHADLKRVYADTKLEIAGDFAKSHPEFRPTLWRGPGPTDVVRVKQSDKAAFVETSNLKFPHDQHLKPGVKSPKGRVTLECRNCHVPDVSERGFVAIEMSRYCLECHALNFEPAVKSRQVPHGSVEDALLIIEEFYANIALSNVAVDTADTGAIRRDIPRASAGIVSEEERQRAYAFARSKAEQVGVDLFEKRVCIVCHDVRRTSGGSPGGAGTVSWTVAPVHIAGTWMPKARFDHAKHRTAQCKDCHRVDRSHRSSDIAIPDIASCRQCHAGSAPAAGKVVSTCISCHGYHLAESGGRKRAVTPAPGTQP